MTIHAASVSSSRATNSSPRCWAHGGTSPQSAAATPSPAASSSLAESGVLIVGSPSLESQPYGSPQSKAGHINCKTGSELKRLLERHFKTVFLFSMNDEVVHTGFYPMAHYLLALCCEPKSPAAKSEIL